MTAVALGTVVERVGELRGIPVLTADLLERIDDPGLDLGCISERVGRDPALAAKVLRVANSSFFGLPGCVGSLRDAVRLLGTANLRTLVLATGLIRHLAMPPGCPLDRHAFWRHGLETGSCAQALARHLKGDTEVAFTAGLLHDIGEFALAVAYPEEFRKLLGARRHGDPNPLSAERDALGVDHAMVGYELSRRWRFPVPIQMAIRAHHEPDEPPHDTLIDIVHAASAVCRGEESPAIAWERMAAISSSVIRRRRLTAELLASCHAEAQDRIADITVLLET